MAPTPGKFYIFDARGTGEPYDINSPVTPMLGHIIKQVQATHPDVVVEHVQFTASLSVLAGSRDPLAPSGDNAANQIVRWLRERIAQLGPDDRYIVLGYSLGATGTTRWLVLSGYTDLRCLMVGHIASPSRRAGTTYGVENGIDVNPFPAATNLRSGIYSTQGTLTSPNHIGSPVPLVEIANPNDVMTSCPKNSPLHAFAGPVMAFSFSDPDGFLEELIEGDGIEDVVASLTRWDNWLDPGWRSWPGDLQAYMTHSHTTDYGLKLWRDSSGKAVSGIDLLARQINWRISREKARA